MLNSVRGTRGMAVAPHALASQSARLSASVTQELAAAAGEPPS